MQSGGYTGEGDDMSTGMPGGAGGLALAVIAIAGAMTPVVSNVAPSAVTGSFGVLVCTVCAALSLRRALLPGRAS